MEIKYIGIPKIIEKYRYVAPHSEHFPFTWYRLSYEGKLVFGSDSIGELDLMVETEEQFDQAVCLVKLGITDKESLQQLLGI